MKARNLKAIRVFSGNRTPAHELIFSLLFLVQVLLSERMSYFANFVLQHSALLCLLFVKSVKKMKRES